MSSPLLGSNRNDPLLLLSGGHPYPSSSSPVAVSEGDGYPVDASHIGSASGSFQNDGFHDAGLNSESEYGFTRLDFRQGPPLGTVELYDRHVFLCYKNPQVWPPRIEAAEFDRLPRLLAATLAARKPDMNRQEVLVKNGEWLPGGPEPLRGWYIFVCCHGSRDRRCGVCGPPVINKFKTEIESHGLQGKVSVSPCSHIGGHKYAGNVIIFGPNIKKEITGHWYGYVMPEDVPLLLQQHIRKGEIAEFLRRGQMGLSEEDQNPVSQETQEDPSNSITESRNNSAKGTSPHKVCSMPTWYESWGREDTYTALAVICAAISVALTYKCYRQLSYVLANVPFLCCTTQ